MAQLDKLIARLGGRETSVLRLAEGAAAQLDNAGSVQPLTRQLLSAAQLTALLREIAPEEARALLDGHFAPTFTYESGGKSYEVIVAAPGESESGRLSFAERRRKRRDDVKRSVAGERSSAGEKKSNAAETRRPGGVPPMPGAVRRQPSMPR